MFKYVINRNDCGNDKKGVSVIFPDLFFRAPAMFQLFFLAVLAIIVFTVIMSVIRFTQNATAPVLQVWARVVGKRTQVSGHTNVTMHGHAGGMHPHPVHQGSTHTSYYITFETDDGQRLELTAGGRQYGLLAEGDTGILTYQGEWYKDFVRD